MLELNKMKEIILFSYFKDSMLEKIAEFATITEFKAGTYIFKRGDDAHILYSVISGEVGLQLDLNDVTNIIVNTITQGMTFAFSALVDTKEKRYITSAQALKDTKLFNLKATDLETLFHQDHELGLLFMKRIAKIIKTRLQDRNRKFLDLYRIFHKNSKG
jgi:CRP-like cAMP-binding protein